MEAEIVKDMNGVPIEVGQRVIVYQDEGVREALVIEPFPDNPTKLGTGHWVDIDDGSGVEGMMSYLLDVVE